MVAAIPAHAAVPGVNGKILFVHHGGPEPPDANQYIWTTNPDGTGLQTVFNLGTNAVPDPSPEWSPDGTRIAFAWPAGAWDIWEIYTINADGSGLTQVTNLGQGAQTPSWSPDGQKIVFVANFSLYTINTDGSGLTDIGAVSGFSGPDPSWSPDGQKIVFTGYDSNFSHLYLMNANGTGLQQLTNDPDSGDVRPDWSPDGQKIVFEKLRPNSLEGRYLYTMNADGTGQTELGAGLEPAWSPDGTKIVFRGGIMNPDGSGRTALPRHGAQPDWQPIPINAYPRPKGASPTRVSLVPAYKVCSAPNDVHGAPLAFGSCDPPVQASGFLTVGTPPQDPVNSIGSVTTKAVPGNVQLSVGITDVRRKTSLNDYPGELETRLLLRITDKNSIGLPGGGTAAGTTQDASFSFAVPCTPTADTTTGSDCSVATTANTLVPGAVGADIRTIWQLGRVGVYDGGPDGDADTTSSNTLFMAQGIFVP